MFCLEFPPVNTTGNYRSAGFARNLSEAGVEVIVFTVSEQSGVETFGKKLDESLMEGLEKVKIFRFDVEPFREIWRSKIGNALRIWWNTTDKIDKRWFKGNSKKVILSILESEKPDAIYFSLPPFSVARMALNIHKSAGIPIIIDMRDAWSLWGTSPHATYFHYLNKKRTEYKLFSKASTIIGVTPELVNDFKLQHSKISPDKFKVIYNGLDEFINSDLPNPSNFEFKIGYVGSFYYSPDSELKMNQLWYKRKLKDMLNYSPRKEQWIYRSPYFFLKALSLALSNNPQLRKSVRFEYIGTASSWFLSMIEQNELNDVFINHGFKDKKEVLRIQNSWNAILATSEKVENGVHFCLPSKIFDSIETKKRILAFVTPGSQENFLKEYPQSVFFNPDSIEKNSNLLIQVINEGNNYNSNSLNPHYSRKRQSLKLLSILYEAKYSCN